MPKGIEKEDIKNYLQEAKRKRDEQQLVKKEYNQMKDLTH